MLLVWQGKKERRERTEERKKEVGEKKWKKECDGVKQGKRMMSKKEEAKGRRLP
jgi:hypothetical protein